MASVPPRDKRPPAQVHQARVQQAPARATLTLRDICTALVSSGDILQTDAERVLSANLGRAGGETAPRHPLEVVAIAALVSQRSGQTLNLERLTQWLADWAGQDYYHIDPLKIDTVAIARVMSFAFAQRHSILAVEIHNDEVLIASAEPFRSEWEQNLRQAVHKELKRVVVNPEDLRRYTQEFYQLATSVDKASGGQTKGPLAGHQNFEQLLDLGTSDKPEANDQHVVKIVDWLLQYAFDQRASDIHIEPRRGITRVRFRIDGVLHSVYEFPGHVGTAVTSRLKILGRLNVAEKRRPQDGRIKTRKPDNQEVELRLATLPTAFGEKMVLRIFDPDVLLKSYEQLGFSREDREHWNGITGRPHGIVLVTGPTGSGKTTTLYSTLKQLATPELNVCTIEDPIEMVEPAFNQMQVQTNIDLTFAAGVRALLRQDPDIIMIGEIRDLETAEMAVQAALTGHLVLSTLHTNDAPSAITRLMELGIPPYLIRATVLGIMAQRLTRNLCPHCKVACEPDEHAWKTLTEPWRAPLPKEFYQPAGCLECRQTGYIGRSGVYEILELSSAMVRQITEGCELEQLRADAYKSGMKSLRLSGAQKVAAGLTSVEEILRVTPESQR
ncbi:GspE/PulE family protein [Marinobacter sp. M3C]|uniref:GspE/PulE family protein n=1 Tax=unclassified Marinobacter TaxID=83889 RepID=UPI00200D0E8B|nr:MULTISPECIES: GspE/PulE family protein [unclassified Marinobacter]MCL1476926.1 GspE/PulE family protein [Marinobacter sp.]MCL1482750.1 GspE/PulE family protein [Marinobacter sp.]MCL1483442.1 GspE/PulE family protein [Marinobacter sp.]MCL1488296.1 GspE/PulE family protein [Marinobacter sp.]UQG57561.1 GspE/PulE family protein [Marinobacter sp. M4C]